MALYPSLILICIPIYLLKQAFWQARLGNGISDPDLALLSENTVWNFTFMQLSNFRHGETCMHICFVAFTGTNYFWYRNCFLSVFYFHLLWNLSFIKVPEKVNWEENIPRGTTDWELQLAVSKLFEERPIWPKRAIYEELLDNGLEVSDHMLRRFLLYTSSYLIFLDFVMKYLWMQIWNL